MWRACGHHTRCVCHRERAEARRLQRQLRKESRGAMRELRKDAVFMHQVRVLWCAVCVVRQSVCVSQERQRERAAVDAERDANFKRAMTILLEQQRDLKSGGQKGMHKPKK